MEVTSWRDRTFVKTLLLVATAGTLLAACASGGGGSLPDAQSAAHRTASAHKAMLAIRIRIPRKRHHDGEAPRYISATTKGMTIAFTGPATFTQVINLTPSDRRCTGSPLTCSIAVGLVPGKYTVSVNTYDQPPVRGAIPDGANLLATARNVPLSVKLSILNTLPVTLDGVPRSFVIAGFPSAVAGAALAIPKSFSVVARDAGGNVIVGIYSTPVTLSNGDSSGATTIATSGSDAPPALELLSSTDTPTLTYTGLAIIPTSITASAAGATSGAGKFTPTLNPISPASLAGGIYVNPFGTVSPKTFTASEVGWTNAPYNHSLTAALSGCSTVATVSPAAGTTFTPTLVASPSNGSCTLTLSDGAGQHLVIPLGYELFTYTGAAQSFMVPAGVAQVTITALSASGAPASKGSGLGGGSASQTATIPLLEPGNETLGVFVGGQGDESGAGGFNGGGTGGLFNMGAGGGGGGA